MLLFGILALTSCNEEQAKAGHNHVAQLDLIPKPQQLDQLDGFFTLNDATISFTSSDLQPDAEVFQMFAKKKLGLSLTIQAGEKAAAGIFLSYSKAPGLGEEGYRLDITPNNITVLGASNRGIAHGLATLQQLALLNQVEGTYLIPAAEIADHPGFKHRGLLLDCSRHFFEKEVVKKYIDLLAFYKMNVLHWHITEDQGWRIEIEKYPRLTEVAAWRTELDGTRYGGFYSKADIKEIVAYAQQRHVTVIPEIELPGHSQAAIAAYPHLSCTGEQVEVVNDWGVFKEIYCAGNDSTFIFLEDVLTEVIELFPSEYIHIGGDEAPKVRWEQCKKCQKRIADEHLEDEHDLQSYFIKRIQTFLSSKGKKLIGWDEILEGGLADGATVQSWRGIDGGIEAVKHGNEAIMSPTSHAYFDYDLKAIDLEKVYSFYPVPEGLNEEESARIIGGEGNMWTEHVPNEANLDSKVFPRLMGMSEVLWSDSSGRVYDEFLGRVHQHQPILKGLGVNYGLETTPFAFETTTTEKRVTVAVKKNIKGLEVKHETSTNGEPPVANGSLSFKKDLPSTISVIATRDGQALGDPVSLKVHPHEALTAPVEYQDIYSEWYTGGGDQGLVDGVLGSLDFRDGHWQGFWGKNLSCVLFFGDKGKTFSSVSSTFYQYNNSWIFIPKRYTVSVSDDGENWTKWGEAVSDVDPKKRGKFLHTLAIENKEYTYRFLKIDVENVGKVPDWHEAAGSDAWIFIDEIIVK